jgi:hypothetical protein
LEAAQMRFLRPLLGYTKLDRQRHVEKGKDWEYKAEWRKFKHTKESGKNM